MRRPASQPVSYAASTCSSPTNCDSSSFRNARKDLVGKAEEVAGAKVALRGPLRGDVDPRSFNELERYEP
jgi:hypothetical protein